MADTIADVARQAHTDLRGLLNVLYASSEHSPATTLPDLDVDLVTPAADATDRARDELSADGFRVDLTTNVDPQARVPRPVDSTVQRILRETVSNIRKHAPAGAQCTLTLTVTADRLELTAVNDLPEDHTNTAPDPLTRELSSRHRSFGLINIRERAELLGGAAELGPVDGGPHGRWRVHVILPLSMGR